MHLTIYDYLVIAFYLVFMFALGPVFKSFSKTSSDYFRGGGTMLWWIAGSSSFMTGFSAMAFVGGAAKAYETGTFYLILFACNMFAMIFMVCFTAAKYRQMRVVTAVEAVKDRFGKANEQIFTWLLLPIFALWGGVGLYTIAVFMSGVFGVSIEVIIFALAAVVVGMTIFGGSWAATAGDFIQMLIVLAITILMALLVVYDPEVGGWSGLVEKMPEHHFRWTGFARPGVIIFFVVTLFFNQLMVMNSIAVGAARYVFVKNGRDAQKAALCPIIGSLIITPIFFIPPVAATFLFPQMNEIFPNLNNPNEASYMAMAFKFLPQGLLGLLVCGVFAASLTSMNSSLNTAAGIFVRNFYVEVVNKKTSETGQIFIGRIFILIYGMLWVVIAMFFKNSKGLQLFDLMILVAASVNIPISVPTFLGIFIKKTPSWAAWGSMVAGVTTALIMRLLLTSDNIEWLMSSLFTLSSPLTAREIGDLNISITTAVILIVCNGFFFTSMLFYKPKSGEAKAVDEFFEKMNTPVDMVAEHGESYESDYRQMSVLGSLSLVYGGFIVLMLFIPNSMQSKICIAVIAAFILFFGVLLRLMAKRMTRKKDAN